MDYLSFNLIELMDLSHKEQINKELESKFICPIKFAQEIEKLVRTEENMNYIDAVVYFCELNKIELDTVPKLISKPLKEKLKCEAMELNFLKKTSHARLKF